MNKKRIFLIMILPILQCAILSAQVSGNAVYSEKKQVEQIPYADIETNNTINVEVSAIYNAIADDYVAIFNASQLGESAALTTSMMDGRLNGVKQAFIDLGIKASDIYIDMITFVPEYEYEVQKKIFSKSYNEIPKGFRLQKNIHVRYKKSKMLDPLIAACAQFEVYDLVKVEYYSNNSKAYYDSLRTEAKKVLKDKLKDYKELGVSIETAFTQIAENTFVKYPQEQYASYQAFNSSSLEAIKKSSGVTQANKNTSYYYNPVSYKGYDVVFNPIITEPVIQYALTMNLKLSMKNTFDDKNNEFYLITPNGDLKAIKK